MKTVKDEGVKVLGAIGDCDPIAYGGGFVIDDNGTWQLEYFQGLEIEQPDTDDHCYQVYQADIPEDIFSEYAWIKAADRAELAEFIGQDIDALMQQSRSPDPVARARLLADIASYWGWYEIDQYPVRSTVAELRKRWDLE